MTVEITQYGQQQETRLKDPGDAGTVAPAEGPGTVTIATTAAETRTLAAPARAGIDITLFLQTYGGNCVITANGTGGLNYAGNNTITFRNQGESVTLRSIALGTGSYRWQLVFNDISGAKTDQSTGLTTV